VSEKVPRKDSLNTRRLLVDAAEQLFAERGIDNTNFVDIARAAGQKNRNVLQYHFGDKESLINAVLDKHTTGIDIERGKMLDRLEAKGEYSLHELVEALVHPVAAKLNDKDSGNKFLKINSQLMAAEGYADLRLERVQNLSEVQRLVKMIAKCVKGTNRKTFEARSLLMDCMLFHGLATYATRKTTASQKLFQRTLVDSITAMLSA
jgi:AcrR family transcriptional regulator